jgi:hypothetical protein
MAARGGIDGAGSQASLEREWKEGLDREHGVRFDRLITLNNTPISRNLEWLESSGNLHAYMETLVRAFNRATVSGLMCRNTISVSWEGWLFDCDFNQMLEIPIVGRGRTSDARSRLRRRLASKPSDRDRPPLLRMHRRLGKLLRREPGLVPAQAEAPRPGSGSSHRCPAGAE